MPVAQPPSLQRGTRLGACVVHSQMGQGSQAQVYLAWDSRRQCPVALKLFPAVPPQTGPALNLNRALLTLRHPNIVALYDEGRLHSQAWLTMEWVPGHDLSHYLEQRWQLPASWALKTLEALALALAHAHGHGLIHRDLKPANVRINLPSGQTKLADFGIATGRHDGQADTGVIMGTPSYMAPECLAGEPASTRSDLYALGVLGFEMLTQRRPHEASHLGQLLQALHQHDAPRLSSLKPACGPVLDGLFAQLLERRPEQRPTDAQQVANALRAAAQALPDDDPAGQSLQTALASDD